MSGRAGQLGAAEQLRLGRQVLRLRAEGALWKQLAHRFGRSQAQLWRYAKSARCKTFVLASPSPRVKEWPTHDLAGVLLASRASAQQPARPA